jgi:hypothetical protein
MKKLFLATALTLGSLLTFAQDSTCCKTKNGMPIGPSKGDFSVGFDAVPVLNYFGNAFNSSSNNAAIGYQQANTIVGSYMKNENTAYRGKLRIGMNNTTADSIVTKSNNLTLGAGIQKYRGESRLLGYYGAEVAFNYASGSVKVNDTETKAPNTIGVGARAFVGVQYFVAPKISIGTEYGWGPMMTSSGSNSSSFSLDVDNSAGAIYLNMFF